MKTIGILITGLAILGGWYWFTTDTANVSTTEDVSMIAVSFYPLEYAVSRIVGDTVEVVNVGAGRDPHDVTLSTQDVATLQRADLVVLQGAGLEPWGEDIAAQLESAGVPVHIATAKIALHEGEHDHDHKDSESEMHTTDDGHEEEEHVEEHEDEHEAEHEDEHGHDDGHEEDEEHDHDHGQYDPHTWVDPVLFSESITHLTEAIVAIDPDNAALYEANAAELQTELAALATAYEERLANCALDEVITSHDAFEYVSERYGFTIHSIAGLSTQDVPSTATLAELKTEAAEGVGAILLEENSVQAYGETLARETGLQTLSINPIAYAVPEGGDYLSVMSSNLDAFVTALQCND